MVGMNSQPSEDEPKNAASEILRLCKACTLATIGDDAPWATSVFFANEALTIYLILEKSGKSMANIKSNPRVALAIDDRVPNRFIQIGGLAEVLEGSAAEKGRQMVYDKLPEYRSFFETVPTCIVEVRPEVIYVSDMARGWFPARTINL